MRNNYMPIILWYLKWLQSDDTLYIYLLNINHEPITYQLLQPQDCIAWVLQPQLL